MRKTLPVSSYRALSSAASSSRLLNCYAEQLPPDTDPPVALIRTPGITDFVLPTVGDGPIYAMIRASDTTGTTLFVVSGTELWTVSETGTGALMGDIGPVNSIDMEWNGTHVVVVNTPNAFYCDGTSSGFGQITDADFTSRGASDVEFLDNYLLFVEPRHGPILRC
jgi:hypothetical protein